jgi:hypothetical protein
MGSMNLWDCIPRTEKSGPSFATCDLARRRLLSKRGTARADFSYGRRSALRSKCGRDLTLFAKMRQIAHSEHKDTETSIDPTPAYPCRNTTKDRARGSRGVKTCNMRCKLAETLGSPRHVERGCCGRVHGRPIRWHTGGPADPHGGTPDAATSVFGATAWAMIADTIAELTRDRQDDEPITLIARGGIPIADRV